MQGFADDLEQVSLKKEEILLHQGATSNEMFVLLSGAMRAEVAHPNGSSVIVARFLPGAPIGEIAFYSAVPRTATVIADEASTLLKIDAESLKTTGATKTSAALVHEYVAASLARRLRNMTMLLRDAEI